MKFVVDKRTGIGGITIGMDLKEVISTNRFMYNEAFIQNCIAKYKLERCMIPSSSYYEEGVARPSSFSIVGGIDFGVEIYFTKLGKVGRLKLSPAQEIKNYSKCNQVFQEAFDWTSSQYNISDQDRWEIETGWNEIQSISDEGRTYYSMRKIDEDSEISSNHFLPINFNPNDENNEISLQGNYMKETGCDIQLSFTEKSFFDSK